MKSVLKTAAAAVVASALEQQAQPEVSDALTVAGVVASRTSPSGLTIAFNHNPTVNKKRHARRNKVKRVRHRAQKQREYEAKRRQHLVEHQWSSFKAMQ